MNLFEYFDQPFSLSAKDRADFSNAEGRIFDLMKDGNWHSASKIIMVSEQREGLRRLRNLRKKFDIQSRRVTPDSREYEYRLVKDTQ